MTLVYAFGAGFILGAIGGAFAWARWGAKATTTEQTLVQDAKTAEAKVESIAKPK